MPAKGQFATEPTYGNRILYFETKGPASGKLDFATSYNVQRREAQGLAGKAIQQQLTDMQRALFLSANRKIPLQGKQLALLEGLDLSGEPLNYFIYPYVEVDGKPWDKITTSFRFEDR